MIAPRTAAVLLVLFVAAPPVPAQEAKPGDAAIEKYLAQETAKLSARFADGVKTADEWQARRPRLRQEYLSMLGLWPLPEKTPLEPKVTGTLERDDLVVEKLHFQSMPGLYVTGNLYRPKQIAGKLPAVLYVCGHSSRGRNGCKVAFQDHGLWFAANGYVCLIIDTLQLGEIPGVHHGGYGRPWGHLKSYGIEVKSIYENRFWWRSLGYTPAGVECWNGVRALDYLVSRPDVDAARLAVTGISGGGAATFWIAAADERVKCAVPVSGMSDLESYVTNKVVNGHCDCMFLVNTYQWEWTTIAALVAPRPLLFANSDKDSIFPMDGNRRIIERLRTLYKLHGKPDLVDEYVSVGGHDYRPDLRVAIFKFINQHIKNDTSAVKDSADLKPFPPEDLRVFPKVDDIPKDARNAKIDETFVKRADVKPPEAGKFDVWKQGLLKELRAQSFRPLPEQLPATKLIKEGAPADGFLLLETEPGVTVRVSWIVQMKFAPVNEQLVILGPGADEAPIPEDLLDKGFSPRYLLPRSGWATKSPPNTIDRSLALLGLTADEGRVRDIIATVRYLEQKRPEKNGWKLIGRGQAGVLAAYAALFEPAISEVVIVDPPASHMEGPTFLNVLRVLDVPDALGMLAPRPLTLVNAKDKAFDRTEQIYKAAGAAEKLQRK